MKFSNIYTLPSYTCLYAIKTPHNLSTMERKCFPYYMDYLSKQNDGQSYKRKNSKYGTYRADYP